MQYENFTREFLELVKVKIIEQMHNKRLFATGEAANSLEVSGDELLGSDYIYYLNEGRGPGKFPPVANIREWVRNKLGISDNADSITFLIGRKISREGTNIYNDKSKGLELNDIVDEALNEIISKLPSVLVAEDLKITTL